MMQILKKTNFEALRKAKKIGVDKTLKLLERSGLKGRGGAGFPTHLKLKFTKDAQGDEKYLICNFDEGEPGTFKDKFIVNHNVENLIEGIAIAAFIIGAKKSYIYLRGEYPYLVPKLKKAIKHAKQNIVIASGAGAYICGEETAIMESIEGNRGEPRLKPPYPAQVGLYGKPTCINNVETLANIPLIFAKKWNSKLRLFSLSGSLKKPGVYELEERKTFKDLIQLGKPKERIKALLFGASGGLVPYKDKEVLTNENLKKFNVGLGSCTVIAVGESVSIPKLCKNVAEFFVHESCGKCTPCREGTTRVLEILNKKHILEQDLKLLEELSDYMTKTAFCPLGQTAISCLKTALKYFRCEFKCK